MGRTINGVIARALKSIVRKPNEPIVYAIVDCARDTRIYPALKSMTVQAQCLYGDVPHRLEQVSPHIVTLAAGERFSSFFASSGWGNAWGIMLRSSETLYALAKHFHRFVRARLPNQREVLFRFYDPRVLRAFLPTCTSEELGELFGPIEAFLMEQGDGSTREYRLKDGKLSTSDPDWFLWLE